MKIDSYTEKILSHAVALHQGNRLHNSIHISGNEIFILNTDKTLLLRFPVKKPFPESVSFDAGDYDSSHFYADEDKVVFVQSGNELERKKQCRKSALNFEEVQEMYKKYQFKNYRNSLSFVKTALDFLEDNLSHLEISAKDGQPAVIQRDIYTGTVIELITAKKMSSSLLGGTHLSGEIESDFGPVGLRTNDFMALFAFNDRLKMKFPLKQKRGYCLLESKGALPFDGVLSYCVYDEMGKLEVLSGR